jgi:hypothetical protein
MVYKRLIPLLLVFVIGLLGFVQEFVPHPLSGQFREEMTMWFRVIGGFALFIGAYSLLHMHVARIRRRMAGWGYSVFVFLGAAVMIAVGLHNGGLGPLAAEPQDRMTWFKWGYENIQVPCSATIFSILAFFMASAAFRTFRARNVGAALLLGAAVIVMFGRVPVSEAVGGWLFGVGHSGVFPRAADAIMEYPNLAAQRGIMLGISLGVISQAVRILFGIERSYLGGSDE